LTGLSKEELLRDKPGIDVLRQRIEQMKD